MPVIQLTQQVVSGLKCPPGKRHIEYCDTEVKGLLLYCTEKKTRYQPTRCASKTNAALTPILLSGL